MKSLIYLVAALYELNYVLSKTTFCEDITPANISHCTNHEITKEELEEFNDKEYDACCFTNITEESGTNKYECWLEKKSELNEEYINSKKDELKFSNLSFNCEKQPDPVPGSGYNNNSIWLSLSLTFLFFGLLF